MITPEEARRAVAYHFEKIRRQREQERQQKQGSREGQGAAIKWWLNQIDETARRVSELKEKDARRSEKARLITQGNRFREAIFQVLRRDGAASVSNRDAWNKFSASDFSTMVTLGGLEYKVHGDRGRQIVQRNTSSGTETAIGRRTFEKYMTLVRHAPNKAP